MSHWISGKACWAADLLEEVINPVQAINVCPGAGDVTLGSPYLSFSPRHGTFLGVNTNLRPQKVVNHLVTDKLTLQQPKKTEIENGNESS